MTVINKWHYSVFLCILSAAIVPLLHFLSMGSFKFETSVWCLTGLNQTKICTFKNICYDSQYKSFLFFLHGGSIIKGFNNYTELQKIQLSSVENHNQFYANLSIINAANYKPTKEVIINSKALLLSRFKPNNIMHSIHDDIFPVFLTLEYLCLGDLDCMESYTLLFHDGFPKGPFSNLYKLFSKDFPVVLNELQSRFILCFEEVMTGLIRDGIFYQYGFKKPHGPVKTLQLTQNDIVRFTSFVKKKWRIKNESKDGLGVVLLKREKSRKILNVDEVVKMVEDAYRSLDKKVEINVLDVDLFSSDLKSVIKTISQSDGLIGMHGAEMILGLFLKPNSYIFEMFPFGIKPEVVSFIKSISHLDGCHFSYFSWRNMLRDNSVAHPDAHPHFGGISHLDEASQNRIREAEEVPPFECCNNPLFLYYMYQDTYISSDFRNSFYESLKKPLNSKTHTELEKILKNWVYPSSVYNISCGFQMDRGLLCVHWYPPFNVRPSNDLWYSLYIQAAEGLFAKEISTEKTSVEVVAPAGITFHVWITAYFRSNNFRSPDLYIKCN